MDNNFRIFKDVDGEISEPQKINFHHEIGDIVTRYSHNNQYKCVEIISKNGEIIHIFKQGKRTYTFDW